MPYPSLVLFDWADEDWKWAAMGSFWGHIRVMTIETIQHHQAWQADPRLAWPGEKAQAMPALMRWGDKHHLLREANPGSGHVRNKAETHHLLLRQLLGGAGASVLNGQSHPRRAFVRCWQLFEAGGVQEVGHLVKKQTVIRYVHTTGFTHATLQTYKRYMLDDSSQPPQGIAMSAT